MTTPSFASRTPKDPVPHHFFGSIQVLWGLHKTGYWDNAPVLIRMISVCCSDLCMIHSSLKRVKDKATRKKMLPLTSLISQIMVIRSSDACSWNVKVKWGFLKRYSVKEQVRKCKWWCHPLWHYFEWLHNKGLAGNELLERTLTPDFSISITQEAKLSWSNILSIYSNIPHPPVYPILQYTPYMLQIYSWFLQLKMKGFSLVPLYLSPSVWFSAACEV